MTTAPAAGPIVEVRGLTRTYRRGRTRAVSGLSLEVRRGEVVGLIGPDGAGKTSTLQVLAGVLRADAGDVRVAGVDVRRTPEAVKARIGYMPQGLGANLYDALTVEENIAFFRDLRRVPRDAYREARERLVGMTRLAPYLDRRAGTLSGGMRQKLALVCTLIHLPDLLLLDEPTTGVDPISRRDFWDIVHGLVAERGASALLATAYMDEAERCHRVLLVHEGAAIAAGPPDTLAAELAGRSFAVRGPHPDDALAALQRAAGVQSATIVGAEVHVLARAADGGGAIRDAGLAPVPRAPGLEDVFVHHLTREAGPWEAGRALPRLSLAGALPPAGGDGAAAVRAVGLTCRFGRVTAVDAVSLEVRGGEILGLLGPNGAGKTTLIRMLCGLQTPTAGAAIVAGYDAGRAPAAVRGHVGYMAQRFSLYRDQTVVENLRLGAGLYGLPAGEREARIATLLDGLALSPFADRLPLALPLGFRQRLALACAILHAPRVLFLDEPTAGVDPLARRQFWTLVHLLAHERGVAVLVSTHYMDEVLHCDRLGFMHDGRLVAVGEPAGLARRAEAEGGGMVGVDAPEFARAHRLLRARFPGALLHGRQVRWASPDPDAAVAEARALLAAAGVPGRVERRAPSMEDAFVTIVQGAGSHRG